MRKKEKDCGCQGAENLVCVNRTCKALYSNKATYNYYEIIIVSNFIYFNIVSFEICTLSCVFIKICFYRGRFLREMIKMSVFYFAFAYFTIQWVCFSQFFMPLATGKRIRFTRLFTQYNVNFNEWLNTQSKIALCWPAASRQWHISTDVTKIYIFNFNQNRISSWHLMKIIRNLKINQ